MRWKFNSLASVEFKLSDIPAYVGYVVFQVHTQSVPVNVSLSPTWTPGKSVHGVNVGVITILSIGQSTATWYVNSTKNETINALVVAIPYNSTGEHIN